MRGMNFLRAVSSRGTNLYVCVFSICGTNSCACARNLCAEVNQPQNISRQYWQKNETALDSVGGPKLDLIHNKKNSSNLKLTLENLSTLCGMTLDHGSALKN